MEITGKIKVIEETKSFGASGFRQRNFVVTTNEQYPQHLQIEATQDKCDILNKYKEGDQVKVFINLRGRGWVNPQGEIKYFNSIQAWKIEKTGGNINETVQQQPSNTNFEKDNNYGYGNDDHDDVPF